MRGGVKALVLAVALAAPAGPVAAQSGQEQTLADIRQELSVLYVELQRLKRQLSTTGAPEVAVGGATALERMDRIEAELQRLTAEAEAMELRVNRIVEDGTNRVGDLEFRLCELEADCDIADLGETPTLGGDVAEEEIAPIEVLPPAGDDTGTGDGAEMAMGEQADFDRAKAAYDAGEYGQAAQMFRAFTETYPGGPLNAEAHFLRGEALSQSGQTAPAARAYLDAFSGRPEGPRAPQALLKLGLALNSLGQAEEGCVMLRQVGARFPGTPQAAEAATQAQTLGCQ
ncbi:tol-pal system protein YbgF [Psychromarinibacter sp. C21-152]|uniref:Cell division coordinator CpoB n=1 Tax=Psychromarinibacter sediminicola TaxID=3033385 RepID=A0AAE3NPR0_9RHOB|nr:tol-pal system protein YbgF [Psychromarinibacter sediminicola]MDF0599846.1 tol-pal system protein YbgF [Psychromarinibacter sediminicola]